MWLSAERRDHIHMIVAGRDGTKTDIDIKGERETLILLTNSINISNVAISDIV